MNPDTMETELPPSTRLRKIVFGGSRKTHFLVGLAVASFAAVVPSTHAAQFHLRYEWAPSSTWTQRTFGVNTGWGGKDSKKDRVWNVYDIDGCYLLNLQRKRMLPPP